MDDYKLQVVRMLLGKLKIERDEAQLDHFTAPRPLAL